MINVLVLSGHGLCGWETVLCTRQGFVNGSSKTNRIELFTYFTYFVLTVRQRVCPGGFTGDAHVRCEHCGADSGEWKISTIERQQMEFLRRFPQSVTVLPHILLRCDDCHCVVFPCMGVGLMGVGNIAVFPCKTTV